MQNIVEAAIAEFSKLNKACLANPLHNIYKLKPGTVVMGSSILVGNATTNQGVAEEVLSLLQITDKIARAAALVAEADAIEATANAAKHAVASLGT